MRVELFGASMYGVVCMGWPALLTNWTVPLTDVSDGFTSTTWVAHPPPSEKCAIVVLSGGVVPICHNGSVVIRKSPRSFVIHLSAVAATGNEEVNVNVPTIESGPLNGNSFKKAA